MPHNVVLTGRPGIGKTTVCLKVRNVLEEKGYTVGGIYCPEIRESGRRIGFEIVDLTEGDRYLLAREGASGPRVGRYGVFIDNLERAAESIERAVEGTDVVIVDEVGPMELKSNTFVGAVRRAADAHTPAIFVVHERSRHPVVVDLREKRTDVVRFRVTLSNRDELPDRILEYVLEWLRER
ncbi:NTPase [Methanopyrus sp.]